MNKFKKFSLAVAMLTFGMVLLSGCSEESDSDIETDTVANIGSGDKELTVTEPELENSSVTHKINYNGKIVTLKATYGIEKKRLNNWRFTDSSMVSLDLAVYDAPPELEISVNNVYSEVSIISKKSYKNGVRQDSMNLSYSQLPNGGFGIDQANHYTMPFQVEGINQNETSFWVINGYGSTSTDRLTESDVREDSQGGLLKTVWTIGLKDPEDNQVFSKTFSDNIGLPCKSE